MTGSATDLGDLITCLPRGLNYIILIHRTLKFCISKGAKICRGRLWNKALMTIAGLASTAATIQALPELLCIRTSDDKGTSSPVLVTLTDLETGQTYQDTTKQGIAEFDLEDVGINTYKQPFATLAPNLITNYAELKISPTTQLEQVHVQHP